MTKKLLILWTFLLCFVMGVSAEEITIDFSAKGYANAEALTAVEQDGITVTFNKGTSSTEPAYYNTGTAARVYAGGSMTVSSASNIQSIVFTFGSGDNTNEITVDCGTFETNTWTGKSTSVKFSVGGTSKHRRIKSLTITTSVAPTVAKPTFTPAEGSYFSAQTVSIACATEGAKIYYTLDGTEPTAASTEYTAPFEVAATTTVKAIAINGEDKSGVATAEYTILKNIANTVDAPMTVAEALAAISANDAATLAHADNKVYVKGIINYVQEVSTSYGNATYSIVDKTGDTDSLLIFRGKYLDGAKFTAEDSVELVAGKEVVIYGNLVDYKGTKEMATNNYLVSIKEPVVAPAEPVVKMTWVDYDNPTTAMGEIAAGETARAGYNKISGGAVAFANTGWGENKITYIQVDASALTGVIAEATLSIDVSGSSDSKRVTGWGLGYNSSVWSADMTYETADKTITTIGEVQWTSTKSASTFETKTFDIADALKNDDDKILTILVYETAAAGGYVKNPTAVIKTVSADQLSSYTIKYVDVDGAEIKPAVAYSAVVGTEATASDDDMAAFKTEDGSKKYIYVGGNTTITTVKDSASNVITLTFREAETYRYSVVAVNGDGEQIQTLSNNRDFEGETIYVPYQKYILNYVDSTLYEAAASGDKGLEYRKSLTLNEDGATINITYTKSAINNVVYFSEAEELWGMTQTVSGNAPVRSSNAAGGYPAEGDVELTGLSTGLYKLTVGFANFKSSSNAKFDFTLSEDSIFSLASTGINLTIATSDEFKVLGNYVPLKVRQGGSDLQAIDFFYIQKTGGVAPVAVKNIREAKKQVSGTPINLQMDSVVVTVCTYGMRGMTTIIEDTTGAIMLGGNMALEGIAEKNVLKGNLYTTFLDEYGSMTLDLADSTMYSLYTATPADTIILKEYTYANVKDSANLYRFVKLGESKTFFDEETWTYYAVSGTDTLAIVDRFNKTLNWETYEQEIPAEILSMTGIIMHDGMQYTICPYAYGEDKAIVGKPVPADIVVNVTEGDITAAVEAEKAKVALVGGITINLTKGVKYTVSGSIEAPASLVINGDSAIIDASALNAPFITLSKEPTAELINNYYRVDSVVISNVVVDSIKNSIFYDNGTQYCVVNFTIDNSVLNLATTAVQNDALVSFKKGGAKDVNILNSTVYGNGVAKYFIRYENNARLDRFGFADASDLWSMTYTNNTFHKVNQSGGQWGNYNGVAGKAGLMVLTIKDNIWVDCSSQIMRRLNQSKNFSNFNAASEMQNNTFWYTATGAVESQGSYGNDTDLTTNPGFADAAAGIFTIHAGSDQAKHQTGDPRWLVAFDETLTGIDGVSATLNVLNGDVYSINGIKVRKAGESLNGLAKGMYIVNGKKFIVK